MGRRGGAAWLDDAKLFRRSPRGGTIRPDYCGAVIMGAEAVSAITETRMRFVNTTYYRDTPGRPMGGVPL